MNKYDIVFLQETHSNKKIEKYWRNEWGGKMLLSHSTTNARGVATLISRRLQCKILRMERDEEGRILVVKMSMEGHEITLNNWYAPNHDEPVYFENATKIMESMECDQKIIGGDFNLPLCIQQDMRGGAEIDTKKNSRSFLINYFEINHIIDVWRCNNPDVFKTTWYRLRP